MTDYMIGLGLALVIYGFAGASFWMLAIGAVLFVLGAVFRSTEHRITSESDPVLQKHEAIYKKWGTQ